MAESNVSSQRPKSKYTLQNKPEPKQVDVRSLTHLYFHDRGLFNITDVSVYENLEVLYLHNNRIHRIEKLDGLKNLTSLYLQHNKIKRIENLDSLKKLKKLYLGFNQILVVEGLTKLENLEELHVEKQNLEIGDSLCFDPRTMQSLGKSLQVLNIAGNNIYSMNHLGYLKGLRVINASANRFFSIEDICETVKNWPYLQQANFSSNPVCKKPHYRENIIYYTQQLAILDDKEISSTTRTFIKSFERQKTRRASTQSVNLADKFQYLPKNYPAPLQKAVSSSILNKKYHRSKSLPKDYLTLREVVRI
ncbi:protein phosphatase 1 regulatory subunit [Rhyzopertha dominica]|nr:protein phosphatase 1 regulatory subunit [Rhyzopertha dominica]